MTFLVDLVSAGAPAVRAGHPMPGATLSTPAGHPAPATASPIDVRALLESDDLEDRLTAVVLPDACPERLARAFNGVRDDARPLAALVRAVVAAKLRVAWRCADAPVEHVRIARAAAGRVPLPMSVEVLRRALGWSWPVRAALGRWLAENPDPIAAMVGDRWRERDEHSA
jgi:hypothetical protein